MERRKIEVTAYAGQRSGEQPRSFVLDGKKTGITEIISQWIEEGVYDQQQRRFFRVKGDDGFIYLLSYEEQKGEWYLE